MRRIVTPYAGRLPAPGRHVPVRRVLGVDPGLTRCGLGVVDGVPGKPPGLVAVGVARTPAGDDIAARLLAIEDEIERWLTEHRPDAVAVERVFSQHNVRTVMGTAQAGAVAIVCAARSGIPVAMHTPSEVKAAVTGSGRADKAQVTHMVTRLLRLADPPKPADAADALALAICHLFGAPLRRAVERAEAKVDLAEAKVNLAEAKVALAKWEALPQNVGQSVPDTIQSQVATALKTVGELAVGAAAGKGFLSLSVDRWRAG